MYVVLTLQDGEPNFQTGNLRKESFAQEKAYMYIEGQKLVLGQANELKEV